MKNIFALITFLFIASTCSAQLFTKKKVQNNQNMDKSTLSWGYYFGVNNLDYKIDYNSDEEEIQTEKTFGFNVGLVGDFRVNDYINLRLEPGLVIAGRNLMYPESYFDGIDDTNKSDFLREVKSTYVYFPLLVRFSTQRINNFKPFITFGVATSINLSSNEKNPRGQ
uniref:type IX secretion/gliding motility protein PorT/SprT n=1 Tax=Lacinutrix neustonica TaxID=2980107 RepID=UPI0028BD9DCC|nr:porin family protein [Lacinutrix neustonica]